MNISFLENNDIINSKNSFFIEKGGERLSLHSYIFRTMFIVIPGTAFIGLGVCMANGISSAAFWWTFVAMILFGAVIGVISAMLNYRRFIAPIALINQHLDKMTNGDLSARVPMNEVRQLKPIAVSLNKMVETWQEVIANIQCHSDEMTQFSAQLTTIAEQTMKATEQIAAAMETMASSSEQQTKTAQEASQVMNEISDTLTQVAENTKYVSANANETSAKAQSGKQSISQMEEQMRFIYEHVQSLEQVVKGLGERSNEIGQITQVITGIASQTNLLALNAAIEAARAGEQGKGFAVVADEVRKLAEQSAQSAKQISQLIGYIQEETEKAIASMETVVSEVSQGIHFVQTAERSFEQIRESVSGVSAQIGQVSATIEQMTENAKRVAASISHMAEMVEQSSSSSANISAATQEQMASVEETASSASSLSEMAANMQMMLKRFTV
ncbi:hypothetical protein B4168_2528 [Anoxybacillus flavithermus]|nr:hypothetical protein B4168_2528 [Anoxybacillus flavithermus]OAO85252.1 Methyl-accepting chemotaxis protein [Parageobacillus thermoglucosidasius]